MYTKLIKFVVLLSLVLLSGFAGRVLYSPLLNRASQGRDPRHTTSRHFMQYPDFMVNGRVVVVVSSLPASQGVFMVSHGVT